MKHIPFRPMALAAVLSLLALGGCTTPRVDAYRTARPVLDMRRWFTGHQEAWGIVQSRSGEVIRRFHVDIDGRTEATGIVLDEHFTYADGATERREWHLEESSAGHWKGRAGDVVGVADGDVAGNALHWRYVLRVPVNGSTYDLDFDDWMFLLDENTLVNRTEMRKFGFRVGNVTLFFRKAQSPAQ